MNECIHDLDPATCSICLDRARGRKPEPAQWVNGSTFPAKYTTTCPECEQPISMNGDMITAQTKRAGQMDEEVRYVHRECA